VGRKGEDLFIMGGPRLISPEFPLQSLPAIVLVRVPAGLS
jgi:hypothetical protein